MSILVRSENLFSNKNLYKTIPTSIIYNSQKSRDNPKCSLTGKQKKKKRWYICITEYYSVLKRFKHVEIHANNKKWKCQSLSHVGLFGTLWTVACHAPLSMEFSRQEYWSRLPFPSPGYLPDPEIEPWSPT